ncbi:hypothetical protein M422DRAFT_785044 [Sphaerobolus stellatus SS14]|uniref:Uncharacterized protein n=1 Tax=Sphaerobolus stellatus (strain SS14) TaxID=990650 RepID=A0A0C9TCZ4_SPHS4|nr:hypothetical protein M422DRAFT_785044 [Sphaerobolus stellatus SS14]
MDDQSISDQRFSWTRGFDRAEAPTQASPSPSQRLDDSSSLVHPRQDDDDDDVDHTLAAVTSAPSSAPVKPRKNQVHTVEWDASLDELKREKASKEATSKPASDKPNHGSPRPNPRQREKRVRKSDKVEDAHHVSKPPDADGHVSKPQ